MSETSDPSVDPVAEARENDIEELASVLVDEFEAVTRAATRLRESSAVAQTLDVADLLAVLAKLRTGRAVDDLTSAFVDLKEQEASAARDLLEELGEGDGAFDEIEELEDDDAEFDDEDFEEFDDDEFDEDDDGADDDDLDDDFEDDDEDDDDGDDDDLDVDDFGEFLDHDHADDRR